jgi:hypothetical protein
MNKRRGIAAALLLTAGSAAAAVLIRKRQDRRRPHVGLYFEDGSMVSLPESSQQASALVELGREVLTAARGSK